MKRLFLLITVAISCFACSKEQALPIENDVIGEWRWQGSIGGLTGNTRMDPPTDGEVILILSSDHSFKTVTNGQSTNSGEFSIVNVTSIFNNKTAAALRLIVNSKPVEGDKLIEVNADHLTLTDHHVEPFTHNYTRAK